MFALALALALAIPTPRYVPAANGGEERLRFAFHLTSASGATQLSGPLMSWDPEARELFLSFGDDLRVFNDAGMEIHRFDPRPDVGTRRGVVPLAGGELLVTTLAGQGLQLVRCDFRGAPLGPFEVTGLPPELAGVSLARPVRVGEKLHFFDAGGRRVVTTGLDGAFLGVRQLEFATGDEPLEATDLETRGFTVDGRENVYLAFPLLFHVGVFGPDGKDRGFGTKGSAPGKFNVIVGAVADDDGYVYVADVLKAAVMVFDPQRRFVGQISGLARPGELLYAEGRVYVSQAAVAGVAVFEVVQK